MSNPVMSNNPYFKPGASTPNQTYYGGGTHTAQQNPYVAADQYPYAEAKPQDSAQATAQAWAMPATSRPVAEAMTYDDAMVKTAILLGVAIVSGVSTALFIPPNVVIGVAVVASIAAFVVGMITAFRPMVGPAMAIAYSALEGVALGGITGLIDRIYPGVAFQAILGTAIVVGVAVFLHMSGRVRTSSKGRRVVLTVLVAYIIFGLINLVLMLTGLTGSLRMLSFGGLKLGLILGVVMIAIGGYMLIGDLETAKYAVANRAPKQFAWTVGLGIVMTILWIYLEVLRLAAIFASDES